MSKSLDEAMRALNLKDSPRGHFAALVRNIKDSQELAGVLAEMANDLGSAMAAASKRKSRDFQTEITLLMMGCLSGAVVLGIDLAREMDKPEIIQ